jgi:hypothetical protein
MHGIRARTRLALSLGAAALFLARAMSALASLRAGNEAPFLAFPLAVILPTVLIIALSQLPPAKSYEGILMRLGTMMQLLAIVALPHLALYLALGLPVVFLVVELYVTRIPASLQSKISRVFVT